MNFSVVKDATFKFGRHVAAKAKDKAPAIFIAGGVVLMTAGMIDACRKTPKAKEILEQHKTKMAPIYEATEKAKNNEIIYTRKDEVKDKALVYSQTAFDFAKLYAPSIFMYGMGIYSILTSHRIMMRRQAALAASYAALHKSYEEYRKQVEEKYGHDFDMRAANGLTDGVVSVTDEKTGEIKDKKTKNLLLDERGISPYTFLLSEETTPEFTRNGIYNMSNTCSVIEYYNERFEKLVTIDAPEILKSLGVWSRMPDEEKMIWVGQGWVWDPDKPKEENNIKATFYDIYKNRYPEKGVVVTDPAMLVELNVQGNVAELYKEKYSRMKIYARRKNAIEQLTAEEE